MNQPREEVNTDAETEAAIDKAKPELLAPYVTQASVRATMEDFDADDISCPLEIIVMAAALRVLGDSTEDHATDLDADGMHLRADEARARAEAYTRSYDCLKGAWE